MKHFAMIAAAFVLMMAALIGQALISRQQRISYQKLSIEYESHLEDCAARMKSYAERTESYTQMMNKSAEANMACTAQLKDDFRTMKACKELSNAVRAYVRTEHGR